MRFILSAFLIVTSLQAVAADPKPNQKSDPHAGHAMDPKMMEMMKKMTEFGTPGEQHKMLSGYAGNWTTSVNMWHKPDTKPEASTGTAKFQMILDGRWLQQELSGQAMGMPYTGLGFVGYNNATKSFESIWMDTFSTTSMSGKGSYDKSKKTLSEKGQYFCPIKNGPRDYRTEWKFNDKNTMTFSMFGPGMNDEPEYKHMEVVYKRVK